MADSAELEAFRADVSEARAKMGRLQEKLKEIDSETQEATTAITSAQHALQVQKESTSSEVFRLKGGLMCRRLYTRSNNDR